MDYKLYYPQQINYHLQTLLLETQTHKQNTFAMI
jgi:hypothetical protein